MMTARKPIPHGTYSGFSHYKCDCDDCRDAKRAYERNRNRRIGYGTWAPYTDAGPVREHVESLRRAGMGWQRIAVLAGLPGRTVYQLLYGTKHCGRPPSRRVRHATAEKLLAVEATLDTLSGHVTVDATGTRRRLQALVSLGWPQSELSRRIGGSEAALWQIIAGSERVRVSKARTVRDLYDRLWDAVPPQETPRQRAAVTRARKIAARRGWVPPMAWDDDQIDDPAAVPAGAGVDRRPGGARLPGPDELLWLVDEHRETPEALADRFGVTPGGVAERIRQARKEMAA